LAEKGPFSQNRIAVIWDFDKTLTPHYMQKPLFEAYDIDEQRFWSEVNALPEYYARAGVRVNRDTCYLGHLLSYVKSGRIPDLTNARLRELGRESSSTPDCRISSAIWRGCWTSRPTRSSTCELSTTS
jgi:hypothetical protein